MEQCCGGYVDEFELLFETSRADIDDYLRGLALDMRLHSTTKFRSLCWRIFLDCLPEDRIEWPQALKKKRQEYMKKVKEFELDPRQEVGDNPLSQDHQSKWNKYFQDEELRQMIQQDVIRTWPEVEVFQRPDIQEAMTSVLFYYSRSKPSVSYRQGMHEILAPIVYVMYNDQRAYNEARKNGHLERLTDGSLRILADVLDSTYLAHDAYSVFYSLMETLESWYSCTENNEPTRAEVPQPFSRNDIETHTVLGLKLSKINRHILKRLDPNLQAHLELLEINPQVYGIRWLRLLFSREYPLSSVLSLWDTIFADSISLDLSDYIFVAMLIAIREQLLTADYSGCLGLLMRYPDNVEVSYVIKLALHYRDHYKYPRPLRQIIQERPKSPRRSRALRPQTLNFCSPEVDEVNWQYMASSGKEGTGVERELSMTATAKQLIQLKSRVAECALSMDAHLAVLQQALIQTGGPESALIALAQLKSARDQLKEVSGADDLFDDGEGGWALIGTSQQENAAGSTSIHNGSIETLKKRINGLINRD